MDTPHEVAPPATLKEYLEGTKETFEIFTWILRHVVTLESKKWIRNMCLSIITMIAVSTIQPGALSYVFNGLTKSDGKSVVWGIGIFFTCLIIQKVAQRYYERSREWVFGLHYLQLEDSLTTIFMEKSLAQHSEQAHLLAPTTIEKGKMKANEIQRIMFFDAIPTILQLALSYICLCWLNLVAGSILGCIILIYIGWSLYLNSRVTLICTPLDRKFRRLGRRRNERMERIERVKVCGKEKDETTEMSSLFSSLMTEDRAFWLSFIDSTFIRSLINATGLVSIMAWGAWLVWKGELNLGLLYPLYAWATRVSDNIWRLGDIEHQLNWNIPPVKSLMAAASIPPEFQDKPDAVVIDSGVSHTVVLDNVSHHYPGEGKDSDLSPAALTRISFTIERGEKVALLGPSGSGKSTVMKKLLRFDNPTSGSIRVDGIDLIDIQLNSWMNGIGYIAQQPLVFDGTIRYNLTYALSDLEREKITDEDLWKLMRLLQIDFGDRLTAGLDTVVGKNGIKLSGGQAQRLMIGAAVIKKPWLLVVDEATSSLDSTTEKLVQLGLETVLTGNTTSALIVAHRLSTVRNLCTKFVVLKNTCDVQEGESQVEAVASTFEELYKMSPTFRQLADDQGIVI